MFFPVPSFRKPDWHQYTFIFPAESAGNVGQLTVDLFLASLQVERIGYFLDENILPLVGNDPFLNTQAESACKLTTSCEIYISHVCRVVFMQLRSPIVKGKQKDFVQNLLKWLKTERFKDVVLVTGMHAFQRQDKDLTGQQFRFLLNPAQEQLSGKHFRENFNWIPYNKSLSLRSEKYKRHFEFYDSEFVMNGAEDDIPHSDCNEKSIDELNENMTEVKLEKPWRIPGAGYTKIFCDECCRDGGMIKLTILLYFVNEGNNYPEAIKLAAVLNHWKQLVKCNPLSKEIKWKFPCSWTHEFGPACPPEIY